MKEKMSSSMDIIAVAREMVMTSYKTAESKNRLRYLKKDPKATSEYIYPNQMEDANQIVSLFYNHNRRVVVVQKKTKVGADGLMIHLAMLMTTHDDEKFVVNHENVRILTGMSNVAWQNELIDKAPCCFKDKIFHHGKLTNADLVDIRNSLIIIDEIDTGDKEGQVLHKTLKDAGILNVKHMEENNNRFVFISATMVRHLYEIYTWGNLHELYKMTIPPAYIGCKEFLEQGIIQEFYPLDTLENAEKWVQEDIIDNYGDDFRVHIVRINPKKYNYVQDACIRKGIAYKEKTSTNTLSYEDEKEIFTNSIKGHVVIVVVGMLRRANLIPNDWKLRIGATHELCTKIVDYNVQNQGLAARLSGYWRDIIENGHKTGPYRTSIDAIKYYEETYNNPFGVNSYQTSGFKKKKGKVVKAEPTMYSSKNIENLVPCDLPKSDNGEFERGYNPVPFLTEKENEKYAKTVGASASYKSSFKTNANGFKECSTSKKRVHSLDDITQHVMHSTDGSNMNKKLSDLKVGEYAYRCYVCYENIEDKTTERYVTNWIKRVKEPSS